VDIQRIQIKNFKRLSDVSVELSDITYLVGGNNSGKSSVLQAIQMAVSCAQKSLELQQAVIAESSLRYCPTGEFETLGNSGPYENRADGSRGVVEFVGKTVDGTDASYKIEIYKARNFHNVGVNRTGAFPSFGQYICDSSSLFSVYVPGLSGIPHHEEMQSFASVFKRAASGEANLVFRNIIRLLKERGKLDELEALLFDIIGPCKFRVDFNGDRDLYVDVKVSFQEPYSDQSFVPIDLSGTGAIQVTQILAYVILFRPKMLLVDEPDSHLHPSRQALLASAFTQITERYKCKILISTHSRHLVSSAPKETKILWLRNGSIENQGNNGLISLLLDLGALDQIDSTGAEFLICTEDRGKKQLEDCIAALNLDTRIKVLSYNGVTNASSAAVIKAMSELFPQAPEIIIHRDRDFLVQDELDRWASDYTNRQMHVFCPTLPDIESYYITPEHVATVYEIEVAIVENERTQIDAELSERMRAKFRDKRRDAIQKFWKDGGGPATDQLWPGDEPMTAERTLGKEVVPKLNERMPQLYGGMRRNLFGRPSVQLVTELQQFIQGLQ
jgi:ABC-type ATPase involved in cell division